MQGINRLPLSSFSSVTTSGLDESARLAALSLKTSPLYTEEDIDSYSCEWDRAINIPKPSNAKVKEFIRSQKSLYSGGASISAIAPKDRYDLNWSNVEDYLDNWHMLSKDDKKSLRKLILADNRTNFYRYGLKRKNLESHLLLSLGCDMGNITNTGSSYIDSNLKSPDDGLYPEECLGGRTVDARSSLRAFKKFNRNFSIETLFTSGFVCYQLVISPDNSYKKLSDPQKAKKKYQLFFKQNTETAQYLTKKKKIYSYLYSHEISVDSILNKEYRPHTHMLVFVKKEKLAMQEKENMLELESWFNRKFPDRKMSFVKKGDAPLRAVSYEKIEKSVSYLFQCYSLSDQYQREIRQDNIRELNLATVDAYHNLIWLYKNEHSERRVKRNSGGYLPRKEEKDTFKHPLLQKKKKSNTIKKENSKTYAATRKPLKAKSANTQRSGHTGSCKGSSIQKERSRAGNQRRVLSRNNRRAAEHQASLCSVSCRTDAETAKRPVIRGKAGNRYEQAAAESKPSASRKTTPGRSEKKLRRHSSAKNERKSGLSAVSDADAQRSDCKSKSSADTTPAKRNRRTVRQLNRLQRTVRGCSAESFPDPRQTVPA